MYRIIYGTTKNLTDVEALIEKLGTNKSAINLFAKTEIAEAAARLSFWGEKVRTTKYSKSPPNMKSKRDISLIFSAVLRSVPMNSII
jgi:hypothetical protein